MNALANPELGKYLNENFVSAFQKVGTFRIVGQQKQGGNVASYFCAQDGRVLHVVAGPVSAATLLSEAKWVVETTKKALAETEKSGKSFKAQFRKAHAKRLQQDHGLMVEAVTFDAAAQGEHGALTYRDPTGRALAPKLPPPPIQGPNVSFDKKQLAAFNAQQDVARKTCKPIDLVGAGLGGGGRGRWVLGNQGRVHMMLAAHSMRKIETLYGSIFEGILGEQVSTKPVIVDTPFPWVGRGTPNGGVQLNALQGQGR